jgi:hypothetical protein
MDILSGLSFFQDFVKAWMSLYGAALITGMALLAFIILTEIKGVFCPTNFAKWETHGNKERLVHHIFIRCESREDAYNQAKAKGQGTEPVYHGPHKNRPDFFHHYHIANHELNFEEGEWRNYHFYFGVDRDGRRG